MGKAAGWAGQDRKEARQGEQAKSHREWRSLVPKGTLDYEFVWILSQFQAKELSFHSAVPASYWWRATLGAHKPPGHPAVSVLEWWWEGCMWGLAVQQPKGSPAKRVENMTVRNQSTQKPAEECTGMGKGMRGAGWSLPHMFLVDLWIFSGALYFWQPPLLPFSSPPLKFPSHSCYLLWLSSACPPRLHQ